MLCANANMARYTIQSREFLYAREPEYPRLADIFMNLDYLALNVFVASCEGFCHVL